MTLLNKIDSKKMTRLTIDLPDTLHKTLKSFSVMDGQTMRNIAINAIEKYTRSRVETHQTFNNSDSIDDNETNTLLSHIINQYALQIKEGAFEGKLWEDVKKEIEES